MLIVSDRAESGRRGTYNGPVANNGEKDGAQKQERDVNECVCQDEGQCSVKSVFGLAVEDSAFFQDCRSS